MTKEEIINRIEKKANEIAKVAFPMAPLKKGALHYYALVCYNNGIDVLTTGITEDDLREFLGFYGLVEGL